MASSATLTSPVAEAQQAPNRGPDKAARARDASRVTFARAIADIPKEAVSCIARFLHTPPPSPPSPPPPMRISHTMPVPAVLAAAPTATPSEVSPPQVTETVARDGTECTAELTLPGTAPAPIYTECPPITCDQLLCQTGLISSATSRVAAQVQVPAPMTTSDAVAAATAEGLILVRERNASGYRNVYPRKSNKYKVAIERNGTQHCLGYFITTEEAALCAARWMRDHPSHRKHRQITASAGLQLLRSTNSQTLRDHVRDIRTPQLPVLDDDDYLDALIYDDAESSVATGRTEAQNIYIGH